MKEIDTTRLDILNTSLKEETEAQHKYIIEYEKTKVKTKVEIINVNEIYLVDDESNRIRRICGAPLHRDALRLRCRLVSGFNTIHTGFGRCSTHDFRWDACKGRYGNIALLNALEKDSRAVDLLELYEMQPRLFSKTNMGSLDGEIAILTGLLFRAINDNMSSDIVMERIDALTKSKVARSKIEVDKLLIDVKAIKVFIKQFLELARQKMSPEKHSELVVAFRTELKFPANDSMRSLIMEENEERKNNV